MAKTEKTKEPLDEKEQDYIISRVFIEAEADGLCDSEKWIMMCDAGVTKDMMIKRGLWESVVNDQMDDYWD